MSCLNLVQYKSAKLEYSLTKSAFFQKIGNIMVQNRFQVIIFLLLLIAFIITIIGVENQFQEKKNQFICQGHLRQWGMYWDIYRIENPFIAEQKSPQEIVTKLESYSMHNHLPECPTKGTGYQINTQILSGYLAKHTLPNKSVLMSDGMDSILWQDLFMANLDYRHLGSTNLLLVDGSVEEFRQANTAQSNNYCWSFP